MAGRWAVRYCCPTSQARPCLSHEPSAILLSHEPSTILPVAQAASPGLAVQQGLLSRSSWLNSCCQSCQARSLAGNMLVWMGGWLAGWLASKGLPTSFAAENGWWLCPSKWLCAVVSVFWRPKCTLSFVSICISFHSWMLDFLLSSHLLCFPFPFPFLSSVPICYDSSAVDVPFLFSLSISQLG